MNAPDNLRLRVLAPGKVNLSLLLGPRRDDGRHQLVTVIESVSLADELTLHRSDQATADEVRCPAVDGDNLALQALKRFRAATGWDQGPVVVEIDKRIPIAAGMGGGSADAAATLRLASAAARGAVRDLSPAQWDELAAGLGADVPSQLQPGLVLGTGAGDRIEPLAPLAPHALLVLPAEVGLSTAEVYREADRLGLGRRPEELEAACSRLAKAPDITGLIPADLTVNDLEPAARALHPAIGAALSAARDHGADPAMVSGSGPTVVGLFHGPEGADRARGAAEELRGRYPRATIALPTPPGFGEVMFPDDIMRTRNNVSR